jgi:hypothetical protein
MGSLRVQPIMTAKLLAFAKLICTNRHSSRYEQRIFRISAAWGKFWWSQADENRRNLKYHISMRYADYISIVGH